VTYVEINTRLPGIENWKLAPHTNNLWYNHTMYYLYLLKSKKDKRLYIGFTNNLKRRLKQHNRGEVISTKGRRPLELVYYEAYSSKKDAMKREKNLKLFSKAYYGLKRRLIDTLH